MIKKFLIQIFGLILKVSDTDAPKIDTVLRNVWAKGISTSSNTYIFKQAAASLFMRSFLFPFGAAFEILMKANTIITILIFYFIIDLTIPSIDENLLLFVCILANAAALFDQMREYVSKTLYDLGDIALFGTVTKELAALLDGSESIKKSNFDNYIITHAFICRLPQDAQIKRKLERLTDFVLSNNLDKVNEITEEYWLGEDIEQKLYERES